MRRYFRRAIAANVLAIALTAALAGFAAPSAQAYTSECTINPPSISCSTGIIAANSRYRAVFIWAQTSSSSSVTCRAHDAHNGSEVGIVTDTSRGGWTTKVIRGLYGHYFLVCVSRGSARGGIDNTDYWTD